MKFLIFLSCVLAFASAGYPYYSPYAQHIPLIDHNGVPVDTPEVQQAKALHFAAHAAASYGQPHVHYGGHANVGADGRPLDTPEVQLAKAAHFIAYNQAAYRNSNPYLAAASAPIETPEVQIAKAAHFEAHAEAKARASHYRKRRGLAYNNYAGNYGAPVDAPDVQLAKAAHLAAHAAATARAHAAPSTSYHGPANSGYNQGYNGYQSYHVPVIGPNGVPQDTPEVQAAKADHFAAVSKAGGSGGHADYSGYSGHSGYSGPYALPYFNNGAPQDTPEVQAAKQQHLAAHAAANHY